MPGGLAEVWSRQSLWETSDLVHWGLASDLLQFPCWAPWFTLSWISTSVKEEEKDREKVEEIPSLSNKRKAIRGKPIKVSVVFYPFIKRRRRQEEKKKKIRLLLRSRSRRTCFDPYSLSSFIGRRSEGNPSLNPLTPSLSLMNNWEVGPIFSRSYSFLIVHMPIEYEDESSHSAKSLRSLPLRIGSRKNAPCEG